MKYFATFLAAAFLAPAFAFAAMDPFDTYVNHMKAAAEARDGTVIESHTSASASSGGQTAGAGQSVTDGDVSASSHVETNINANDSGGSVHVKVETSKDGVTEAQEYTKSIAPGEGIDLDVSTSSSSGGASVSVKVKVRGWDPGKKESATSSDDASSLDDETSSSSLSHSASVAADVGTFFTAKLPDFFKRIFSFFWRF